MVTFHHITSCTLAQQREVQQLYRSAEWWYAADEKKCGLINRIITGSHCFCIAIEEDEIIAMGRAISDGVSDAYIQDISVREDSRKKGIGTALVRYIIDILKKDGIAWISLIASPESRSIYQRLGFEEMAGGTAMLLQEN